MSRVNPPPHRRIPQELRNDPILRAYFEDLEFNLFQLWKRTGGGEDLIDSTEQFLTSTTSRTAVNAAKIGDLEREAFEVEIITEDFQTKRNQIIICRNSDPITVILDPDAQAEDIVHIKRKDGLVTVVGLVDGRTPTRINIKNFSMQVVFDGTEWSQI